ncbi:MAG: hypothetical protein U9Q77_12350 [Candidatus Marinimicrobia bacterium]|nr:hypothetical protein [Candidatus Neomarinimicrobiota bacterium]
MNSAPRWAGFFETRQRPRTRIFNSEENFELSRTRIAGNSAEETGGGLHLRNPRPYTITNCLITGNKANEAGDGVILSGTGVYSGTKRTYLSRRGFNSAPGA